MEVRERILEAALSLLAESGAHELTQPRVAKAAGVRQSHLTYYFPTRADLLQEVARYSIAMLAGQLAHARVHNPAQVAHGIAAGSADKRRVRVLLGLVTAADRDPKIRQRLRKFIEELRGMMTPALAQSGLETDPDSVAFFHSVPRRVGKMNGSGTARCGAMRWMMTFSMLASRTRPMRPCAR